MIALVIKYGCVVLCLWTESVCHAQHGWSLSAPHDIWTGQPTRIPPFLNPFLIPAIVHGVSGVPVRVGAADASDVEAKLLMFSYYPESLMDSEAAAAGSQLEWILCYQCRTNDKRLLKPRWAQQWPPDCENDAAVPPTVKFITDKRNVFYNADNC